MSFFFIKLFSRVQNEHHPTKNKSKLFFVFLIFFAWFWKNDEDLWPSKVPCPPGCPLFKAPAVTKTAGASCGKSWVSECLAAAVLRFSSIYCNTSLGIFGLLSPTINVHSSEVCIQRGLCFTSSYILR